MTTRLFFSQCTFTDEITIYYNIQDERISKLSSYSTQNPVSAVVEYLNNELGGKDGLVYGGLCFNENFCLAHFLIMAVIHINGDGIKLTVQVRRNDQHL